MESMESITIDLILWYKCKNVSVSFLAATAAQVVRCHSVHAYICAYVRTYPIFLKASMAIKGGEEG